MVEEFLPIIFNIIKENRNFSLSTVFSRTNAESVAEKQVAKSILRGFVSANLVKRSGDWYLINGQ